MLLVPALRRGNRVSRLTAGILFIEFLEDQCAALRAKGWGQPTEHAWEGIYRSLTDGKLGLRG